MHIVIRVRNVILSPNRCNSLFIFHLRAWNWITDDITTDQLEMMIKMENLYLHYHTHVVRDFFFNKKVSNNMRG